MMIRQGMMVKDLGTILVGKMAVEEGIIDEVCESLSTGMAGDGKIYVSDVSYGVRIRTKERVGEDS